jgi:hypothetical protein
MVYAPRASNDRLLLGLKRNGEPIKSIWVYPLVSDFRRHLCNA